MAFQISQLKNNYLKDIALLADDNNDGIISDGKEVSIFLEKSKEFVVLELCTNAEYNEILEYCPRVINGKNKSILAGTEEYTPNSKEQEDYLKNLKSEISDELEKKQMEQTPENIALAIEVLKKKKALNLEIKVQEKLIEKLKEYKSDSKRETKMEAIVSISMTAGSFSGAALGFKVGVPAGPVGMVLGLVAGGIIGSLVAGITGGAIANAALPQEKSLMTVEEIQENLDKATNKLQELQEELKSYE